MNIQLQQWTHGQFCFTYTFTHSLYPNLGLLWSESQTNHFNYKYFRMKSKSLFIRNLVSCPAEQPLENDMTWVELTLATAEVCDIGAHVNW